MIFKGVLSSTLPGVRRKPGKFSLVIDDQVQFEFIEPAQCTFSGKFLEGLMRLFSFGMAASNGWGESIKEIPVHCPNLSF